jgi:hypothetical protein
MQRISEYEQFVERIRHDPDWTGPDPSPQSTLQNYAEDHRTLIAYVNYGGKKIWDGFHTSRHPSPTLSEPGDWAADRILTRGAKTAPRSVGASTPDYPSRKAKNTFDAVLAREQRKKRKAGRNRMTKKILRRALVYGATQLDIAKETGVSRTTARRVLTANAPELAAQEKAAYLSRLHENSKWGWLVDAVSVPPYKAEVNCAWNASKVANYLRTYLSGSKIGVSMKFSVRCLSATAILVQGSLHSSLQSANAGKSQPVETAGKSAKTETTESHSFRNTG